VIAFEDGFITDPAPRFVQRVVAVRERPLASAAQRYPL
jgi:hypothetical protein